MDQDGAGPACGLGAGQSVGDREFPAVERHMVAFRHVRFERVLVAVPRVLDVHVLVVHQTSRLQVSRNLDAFECGVVEVFGHERLLMEVDVGGLHHLHPPFAVKALPEIRTFIALRHVRAIAMSRMCRHAVDREDGGVGEPSFRGVLHAGLFCHDSCFPLNITSLSMYPRALNSFTWIINHYYS